MDSVFQGCSCNDLPAGRRSAFAWVAALVCCLSVNLNHLTADDEHATIETITVGYDGYYQLGRWSPIDVAVRGSSSDNLRVVVVVTDPDGHPTRMALRPETDIGGDATDVTRWTGLFRMGRMEQPIQVVLFAGDDVVDTKTVAADDIAANRPLTTRSSLWLLVGQTDIFEAVPEWLKQKAEESESSLQREVVPVHTEDLSLLPRTADAYDSIDLVVLVGHYELSESQSNALRDWVADGGRLIVSIGERLEAYQASRISEWVPIGVERPQVITSLGPLTGLVATSSGISFFGRIVGIRFGNTAGRMLAVGSEGALLVRTAYGFGSVTASAFNLDLPVVIAWEHAPEMALKLTEIPDLELVRSNSESSAGNAIGKSTTDLQTQLATAIDQYEGVAPVTNFIVLGFLAGYLIVVGLLDYMLVHRVLRRPYLTWVTLPVWLICGVLIASAVGRSFTTSGDAGRRVVLVDVAMDTGKVRIHDWLALYSAEPQRQDIHESVDLVSFGANDVELSWSGLPETGFRGMFRRSGLSFGEPAYDYDLQSAGLSDFPRLPNASRVLEGQCTSEAPTLIESSLRENNSGQLSGTFTHHLPVPITDWFVAYRNTVYYSTDETSIPAGVSFSLDGFPHPVIKYFLTRSGARTIDSDDAARTDAGFTQSRYDASPDADIGDILRLISFHEAADGSSYTGLDNRYLDRLELTHLLDLNRAVVFGRIDHSVLNLGIDGEPFDVDTETYVRLVIPVATR